MERLPVFDSACAFKPQSNQRTRYNLPPDGARMMLKETWQVRLWSFFNVPMIWLMKPTVMEVSDSRCVLKVPLNRRNRNHLRSMYVGVMCAGADVAGGLIAWRRAKASSVTVLPSFKDIKGDFHKRAEGDVFFICEDGERIGEAADRAIESGERQNVLVRVRAMVPDKLGEEPAASFELTLSLKRKD